MREQRIYEDEEHIFVGKQCLLKASLWLDVYALSSFTATTGHDKGCATGARETIRLEFGYLSIVRHEFWVTIMGCRGVVVY
jgi:hypothetical protein